MMNMLKDAPTVTIALAGADDHATDLLTCQEVSLDRLRLAPMEPRLLRLNRAEDTRRGVH